MGKGNKHIKVQDFVSMYSEEERVVAFWRQIDLSNTRQEEDVIMEICLKYERVNMFVKVISLISYFYFHLPVIFYLGVLIHFTQFEVESLSTANISPFEVTLNVWSIIWPLKFYVSS